MLPITLNIRIIGLDGEVINMAVFFKCGKVNVKRYDNLCPDRFVYLKYGKYLLDLSTDTLLYIDDESYDPINILEVGPLQFYIDLDVDFGRDKKIPLKLDKRGTFVRTDRISGSSTIKTLFSCKQ